MRRLKPLSARQRRPDLARARALVAEVGYPRDFEMDFHSTNNRLPGDAALCEALAQPWSRRCCWTARTSPACRRS